MPTIKSDETVVLNINDNIKHGGDSVRYFASVKNTEEGREWIKNLRKKNPDYKIVIYPTGTNRRERFKLAGIEIPTSPDGSDKGNKLPYSVAERFRVYVKEEIDRINVNVDFNTIKL